MLNIFRGTSIQIYSTHTCFMSSVINVHSSGYSTSGCRRDSQCSHTRTGGWSCLGHSLSWPSGSQSLRSTNCSPPYVQTWSHCQCRRPRCSSGARWGAPRTLPAPSHAHPHVAAESHESSTWCPAFGHPAFCLLLPSPLIGFPCQTSYSCWSNRIL